MPRTRKKSDLLTSVELEFMKALWTKGPSTVRQVQSVLNRKEVRAYTSIATVLKVLHDKGYVTAEKVDRHLVYKPNVAREDYECRTLRVIADSLFEGSPTALVSRVIEDQALSYEALSSIKSQVCSRIDG